MMMIMIMMIMMMIMIMIMIMMMTIIMMIIIITIMLIPCEFDIVPSMLIALFVPLYQSMTDDLLIVADFHLAMMIQVAE